MIPQTRASMGSPWPLASYAGWEAYRRLSWCKLSLFFLPERPQPLPPLVVTADLSLDLSQNLLQLFLLCLSVTHHIHTSIISLDLCRGLLRLPCAPPGQLASCTHTYQSALTLTPNTLEPQRPDDFLSSPPFLSRITFCALTFVLSADPGAPPTPCEFVA